MNDCLRKYQAARYVCYNCDKTFSAGEMKFKDVDTPNFTIDGQEAVGTFQQCPHCDAVAVVGFNLVHGG